MKRLPGIQPSKGCTEPAAIALAAALAARALGAVPERVAVRCDRATLKNALAACIPGTGGARGAELAAALGALSGEPACGLEVLCTVTAHQLEDASRLVAAGQVVVELAPQDGPPTLYIAARAEAAGVRARALLAGSHTRLEVLERDGAPLSERPDWARGEGRSDPTWEGCGLAEVLALADLLSAEDEASLLNGLDTNLEACGDRPPLGRTSTADRAEAVAAAGSRARMEGDLVTVITSGFSGNQGLVAAISVWAVAEAQGAGRAELARALATSHLVGSFVRASTGLLSSFCNAAHAASAGAAAGCVQLMGGGLTEVERACKLVLATSAGILCDGGKPACSLKVGLGAAQAVRSAERAMLGDSVSLVDGLGAQTLERMLANLKLLSHTAMPQVDAELLEIVRGERA